jgi:hypothetical protein
MVALLVAATSRAGEVPPAAQEMAKTCGVDSFDQIEAIRYTFNIEFPGAKVARSCGRSSAPNLIWSRM